jgi:hypothetical protein
MPTKKPGRVRDRTRNKGHYAQERANSCDDHPRSDEPSDNGHLATRQEARDGRHALRVRIDEDKFAPGELHCSAREVVRVEAVLREAGLAERRARQGRARAVARAVDSGALRALAEVRVGRVGARQETADHVCVDLVEEDLGVQRRVLDFERAGAVVFLLG